MSDRVELDESLVVGILTPLMEYADLLNEASDYGKSRMLCVLIDDAQSQLENVFEFQETILHAFRAAGCDFKRLNGKQLDRHMRLRSELRKCV